MKLLLVSTGLFYGWIITWLFCSELPRRLAARLAAENQRLHAWRIICTRHQGIHVIPYRLTSQQQAVMVILPNGNTWTGYGKTLDDAAVLVAKQLSSATT